jgi:glucosamine-6-phosphate deaminase
MSASPLLVLDSPDDVAATAAALVANRLGARPRLRVLLPTGHTPEGLYARLRERPPAAGEATALQLDEYLGLGRDDPRSFAATLDRELAGIGFGAHERLDGAAADPGAEAARYEAVLDAAPIDLAVLGIGRDGHVAFDEPGTPTSLGVHRARLTEATIADNAGAFGSAGDVPREALTTGLRTLRGVRELLVLATGEAKADAVEAMLEEGPTPDVPASLLREHPELLVVCDRAAASRVARSRGRDSDRVAVVLGHREPGDRPPHRISEHSRARLRRAEKLGVDGDVRAVVLTGFTSTGGLSEAEQMAREWVVDDVPAVLEVAGRNTAGNAGCSLPILEALGGVRRVAVVTSWWHLRARYFFAPYRRRGLAVDIVGADRLPGWGPLLGRELAQLPRAPRERREAFGA